MKKIAIAAVFLALLAVPALGQTSPPPSSGGLTLSTGSQAIGTLVGKDWNAGTDLFGELSLTKYVFVRSDNYVMPDGQSFFAGPEAKFAITDLMKKTTMASDASRFQFGIAGEAGVTRTAAFQRTTWNALGHIDFDIKKDGSFALNLIQYSVAGGLATPTGIHSGKTLGTGLTLTFK